MLGIKQIIIYFMLIQKGPSFSKKYLKVGNKLYMKQKNVFTSIDTFDI